jgi:hypothetical protein
MLFVCVLAVLLVGSWVRLFAGSRYADQQFGADAPMSSTTSTVERLANRGSGRRGAIRGAAGATTNGSADPLGTDQQQPLGSNGNIPPPVAASSTPETNEEGTPAMDSLEETGAPVGAPPELPRHLMPSRVQLNRIQIGPRLRPAVHAQFSDYIHQLGKVGVTQSDVVESALLEYMDRYPPEVVRAALLEAR